MIRQASLFGDDERRTEQEFAQQRNLPLKDVQDRYAASGAITCRGSGKNKRSIVNASGQLTVRSDLITTTAHTILGKDANLIGRLESCVFETRINGRKVSSRLTSDYITGFRDAEDANFSGFDWAVIRLQNKLPVEPYQIIGDLTPLFRWLDVANVTKVANFNFENWGEGRTKTKSLADCVIKPEAVAWSSGVRGLRTDCDIAPGNSGGAVLSEVSGKPQLIGIIVGTTATSFKTRKPFDLYHDYNIGALVEGEFLQAIRDMASRTSVREIQLALAGLGHDPGAPDGVIGNRTRSAIRSFQEASGLTVTGTISPILSLAVRLAQPETTRIGSTRTVDGSVAPAPFDAASDVFLNDLYRWRLSSLLSGGTSAKMASMRPKWLNADGATADIVGPQSAWASARLRGCRNVLACLHAYGAPDQALRAAYALEKSGLVGTYVSSFIEYGAVDLVSVGFPYNAGGNIEYALVNGAPSAVAMRSGDVLKTTFSDVRYDQLRKENPRTTIRLAPRFESYRLLAGNHQRFVFAYPVTTGCQTCKPLGQVFMAYDFAPDGQFDQLKPVAFADSDDELDRQVRRTYKPENLSGDIALVQRRLNGLGYEAGVIDGISGSNTEDAISDFQREHSLDATGELDAQTAKVLATDGAVRHIRRFETLLSADPSTAAVFGAGLLARIRQVPDSTAVDRASLANNIAGTYRNSGRYTEAQALLRKAEASAEQVSSVQPALYASILVNISGNQISLGNADLARKTLGRAWAFLQTNLAEKAPVIDRDTLADPARTETVLSRLREFLTASPGEEEDAIRPLRSVTANGDIFLYTPQFAPLPDRKS